MAHPLTTTDLARFKSGLLRELYQLLVTHPALPRKWLRSHEVCDLLDISPNTLKVLRHNGTLSYTTLNRTLFYNIEEIDQLLESRRKRHTPRNIIRH